MAYEKTWKKNGETLNSIEVLKLNKDPLDILETVFNTYANSHLGVITDEDKILLKWVGVYEHKPKNGFFMLRIRINSGKLTVSQARGIADISKQYSNGFMKITTRGAIQLYHIQIADLADIFNKLTTLKLSCYESCGDCPRTIIGNPLAGIDKDELLDTTGLVDRVNDFFLLNEDFSNLPRKLKLSISSSEMNPGNSEINDISFTPALKVIEGNERTGFHVKVGGGLSSTPIMAKDLPIFVLEEQVLKVATSIAVLFRDFGYRKHRNHARLKFLIEDWGIEKFTEKLLAHTGPLLTRGADKTSGWNGSNYYGIHDQKQAGKKYLGLHIPLGELKASEFLELADISELYGDAVLRTTSSQNLILSGIDVAMVDKITSLPLLMKFTPKPKTILSDIVVCTGKSFCNFALTDTQNMARELSRAIDDRFTLDVPIRIHITGCPNSCGHLHIADIGLQATFLKNEFGTIEAFDIFLGGTLGPGARFATKTGMRIPRAESIQYICNVIELYQQKRIKDESMHAFLKRCDSSVFQNYKGTTNTANQGETG